MTNLTTAAGEQRRKTNCLSRISDQQISSLFFLRQIQCLVCSNSTCVELDEAYGETNCSITCKGNAVCNNKAECQCIPGWVPPGCTNRYTDHIIYTNNAGPRLSREAYTAIAACVAVILAVLVVAVTVAAVWRIKMRKREQSQQSHPEAGGNTNHSKSDYTKQTPKVFIIP
ncbi:disintegrin and metalloproteinase domain-containing protein 28-like [Pygocentrus nattereri]|uniref:disintegrin and metalloproteinase domain-containing protein 28-like n=1 Tax=Pygocentrus nattereri TaxID=42514 RepID=UPI001890CBCE|nr:disintegrin and metalloproteinase domain-containing protein 28-like [Pygocentrus nattereri]